MDPHGTPSNPPAAAPSATPETATKPAEPEISDEQILAAEAAIRDAEARANELVSVPLPLETLVHEYAENAPFLRKIERLRGTATHYRRCRGDGNCFYRAFVYAWYERVLHDPTKYLARAKADLAAAKQLLLNVGFQLLVIEDFLDVAEDTLRALESRAIYDDDMLLSRFQSDEVSNAVVVLFRFVTSAFLQAHADDYLPFVLEYADDMGTYCAHHVEAMGRDADHLHIMAVSRQFAVNMAVTYLDGSAGDEATVHKFEGDDAHPDDVIGLLYRPGHYDLIYRRV
ncbi:hypothetical protein H9P43_001265 [Blastocladiella emersonii ATCC 22665]|nr:hypothetical protein H9P43_001265 [Blastocladiella emersonii ATCC 22665]